MVNGTTKSGFSFEMDKAVLNNMELVDALAQANNDNPIAVSQVCHFLLGEETRAKLYNHLRDEHGRVPIEKVTNEIIEIFEKFKEDGKK